MDGWMQNGFAANGASDSVGFDNIVMTSDCYCLPE
jgi:hypothetical protein